MRNHRLNHELLRRRDPFLSHWEIPAPRLAEELVALELLLPCPKRTAERWHDDVDLAARSLFVCATCDARRGIVCSWAELRAVPSWCAHAARRRLVDASVEEHARLLRRFSVVAGD